MAIIDRELEEDEAQIDNILHKIIQSCDKINRLKNELSEQDLTEIAKSINARIGMLSDTIINLSVLADEIDLKAEKLETERELVIKKGLRDAIANIKAAESVLGDEV